MKGYGEPLVARVTGVARHKLKLVRDKSLEKPADWSLEKSVVTYSERGLEKLLSELGLVREGLDLPQIPTFLPPGLSSPSVEAGPPESLDTQGSGDAVAGSDKKFWMVRRAVAERALVELRVVKLTRNPRLLMARAGEDGEPVRVRVRSNANFRPGMKLKAREPEDADGAWAMEGRCPRFPGRM